MPSVNGALSARMIRFWEKESKHANKSKSPRARDPQSSSHRIPIIAVSSSLYEEDRFDYIQNGYVVPLPN